MNIDAPASTIKLLDEICARLRELLKRNLVGIYLHGSLAMNCFNPKSSDVDFIVVTAGKLSLKQRQAMAELMIKLDAKAPPKGLEMSVVTLETTQHFKHPTPFEFHFSREWLEPYKRGQVDLTQDRKDGDLAGHFTIIKDRGVVLYGKPIDEVFAEVPAKYYKASILADAKAILKDMSSNPVYDVLNLCRVWAYMQDGLITSKKEGGEWALQHVESKFKPLVQQALAEYQGLDKTHWDDQELSDFGEVMHSILKKLS